MRVAKDRMGIALDVGYVAMATKLQADAALEALNGKQQPPWAHHATRHPAVPPDPGLDRVSFTYSPWRGACATPG